MPINAASLAVVVGRVAGRKTNTRALDVVYMKCTQEWALDPIKMSR